MLFGIWLDHGKDVSALLLLIHPGKATTSPLFWRGRVQFLEEKWPFLRYTFHCTPQGSQSIRCWCCLVFDGIMEKMYQHCCCSSILHKHPLHPILARPTYNFWKRNGRFRGTPFSMNPKGSQVLGFDAAWYLLGSWKRCISTVVAHPSCTSHHSPPFWRGRRTIFGREMAFSTVHLSL